MFYYKYILLCDFDEFLQPTNDKLTLLDFIKDKDSDNIGSFTFGSRYHITNVSQPSIESFKQGSNAEWFLKENLPIWTWNNVSGSYYALE